MVQKHGQLKMSGHVGNGEKRKKVKNDVLPMRMLEYILKGKFFILLMIHQTIR